MQYTLLEVDGGHVPVPVLGQFVRFRSDHVHMGASAGSERRSTKLALQEISYIYSEDTII